MLANQLSADTVWCLEDLPRMMANWDGCQDRVKEIHAVGITWRAWTKRLIDWTLSGTSTLGQSGPGSNDDEGVLHITQSFRIGASTSDGLLSYPGHSLVGSYPFAEIQSVYSTVPTDRVVSCGRHLSAFSSLCTLSVLRYSVGSCMVWNMFNFNTQCPMICHVKYVNIYYILVDQVTLMGRLYTIMLRRREIWRHKSE